MIRLEVKRRRTSGGGIREQLYAVEWKGGKRKRVYVRESERGQAYDIHFEEMEMERKVSEPREPRPKGRPPALPKEMYEIARLAGYARRGTLLSMSRSEFLKLESAAVRFHLLDEPAQAALGSPERLHEASVKAVSMLKSMNRRGIPTTFAERIAEVLTAM